MSIKRYPIVGDEEASKEILSSIGIEETLHTLFGHWINAGFHVRDFDQAINHSVYLAICEKHLCGIENIQSELFVHEKISKLNERKCDFHRFYDDNDIINPKAEGLCRLMEKSILSIFKLWVDKGFYENDFIHVCNLVGKSILYDYEIHKSLSEYPEKFLTSPYVEKKTKGMKP